MSDIICQWLNEELGLSRRVDAKGFAKEFATGYLIGEVLHKYQLQDDFDQFSQSRVASAKLNNFTRVEPTLQLLGIPFDQNVAQSIISEQHGTATRLLYQLYVALQRKKKAGLTGVTLETLRPAAPAKLQSISNEIYKERLKKIIPRQTDLDLQQVTEQFEFTAKEMNEKKDQIQHEELKKMQKIQEELRMQDIEKLRRARRRQNEIMARIQAAIVQIPKPPADRTLRAIQAQKILRKKKEAEEVYQELARFEKSVKKDAMINSTITPNGKSPTLQRIKSNGSIGSAPFKLESTDDYVRKIQKRLEEDTTAREQREKRRRRVLIEQLFAHGAQEEAFREEQLINRLMRQSQQERRIAVQLMQTRHEKDIIRENRIFREKQYEEHREKEFQEALDIEAALQHQAKLDAEEQMRKVQELHDQIAAERAEARYKKHYGICQEIVYQIIDLVTKTGEYRELTNRLIPNKVMREWKEIFTSGFPLYEEASIDPLPAEPTLEQLVEMEKENLLNNKDFEEYQTMSGEWILSDCGVKAPAPNNNILGHVVHRLLDIVNPPPANTPPPVFPPFPIKGCVLGKPFSGKSNCLKHLAEAFSMQVLCVDTLVKEALQAYENNEMEQEDGVFAAIDQQKPRENKQIEDNVPAESRDPRVQSAERIPAVTVPLESDKHINDVMPQTVQSSTKEDSVQKENKLSARAELGKKMEIYLKKGKAVPDELLVDILITAINHIPAISGWVIDGFPATLKQAKLIEKALTGFDPDKTAKTNKKKTTTLVEDPNAPQDPPPPPPALNFVALLEISDNMVLQRAAEFQGQREDQQNPQKDDHEQKVNQIQHRITGFLDNWPKLEEWFSLQNILVKVDGEVEEGTLYQIMENVFSTALLNKQNKEKEAKKKEEILPLPVTPPAPSPPPPPPPETTTESSPPSSEKKKSAKKGKGRSKSPKDSSLDKKEKKAESPQRKDSAPKSANRGRSPGKKKKSAPSTPEPPTPMPVGPPPIQPGSAEWVYVDEPLSKEIPEFLVPYWETIEKTYDAAIKAGLKSMREERFMVIHYLYDIREEYKNYLKRPDHKQEFVSLWQSDFNSIPEDLWEDEETKAELHQRLDDLRDCLWDICDNKREEAEQERENIMNDGWLQDHLGILMNHFFSLMQAEVDRFQDTMRFLHDYYQGMESKIPSESSQEFARIPLLEIANAILQDESEQPKRIPLVLRKTQSPEQSSAKQRNKQATIKGKEDPSGEITAQNSETDQKMINDTWQTALSAITNMVMHEKEVLEAEEETERHLMEAREKERLKASRPPSKGSKKGAKKKSPKPPKSPKGKKGGKSPRSASPSPTPTVPEDNTELQRLQELKMKMKQEYFAALECEEAAVNGRLELVKTKALEVYEEMLSKAQQAYKDMNMWQGARFLAEMSSIDKFNQVVRHHIEISKKIQCELVLEQTDFYISSDVKVFPDPLPPPRPLPVETSSNGTLTISQLYRLHQQFLQMAPEGIISNKKCIEILMDLTSMSLGDDTLPDLWMHLTLPEIHEITSALSSGSDVVNWRQFLLSASLPWPYPSLLQLLGTLQRFQAADPDSCGTVTEETYSQVELWFTGKTAEVVPEDPTEPLPFNRLKHLIKFFFDLFANQKTQPAQLHYVDMLLYFASHPDPKKGFHRALSVVTGKPIMIKTGDSLLVKSYPNMGIFEDGIMGNEDDMLNKTEEVTITLHEVLQVFEHGVGGDGESHRFYSLEKEASSKYKRIQLIFSEINPDNGAVPVTSLLKHASFCDLVESCQHYKLADIQTILQKSNVTHSGEGDTQTSSLSGV